MTTVQVSAEELAYVDRAAGSDKFYRVFVLPGAYVVQYGRSGTFGTFKRTACADADMASKAAAKQADAKFKKGYERMKSAVLDFDGPPSDSHLDAAMSAVAPGATTIDAGVRQAALHEAALIKLNEVGVVAVDAAVESRVRAALTAAGFAPAAEEAVGPVPVRPMLANTAEPTTVTALLADDAWCAQAKLDGERFVIEVANGSVAVYNRQGQPKTSNVSEAVLAPFRQLATGRWVVDGELVGRKLWLFDMVAAGGHLAATAPFSARYTALTTVLSELGCDEKLVGLVATSTGSLAKTDLLDAAVTESREGVIFRRVAGTYQPGRRSAAMLKHKLVKTADCIVVAVQTGGKANASLAVHGSHGRLVALGTVSTIGKGPIAEGDVVEVRFLYVVDPSHPRMFQPRLLGVRTNKSAAECSIDQFAYAGTNKRL